MRMKGVFVLTFALLGCLLMALPAAATGAGDDDIARIPDCPLCGMDRHKFAHSRVLIRYEDAKEFGACSLHCAALEMAYHIDRIPAKIQVGDYNGKQLIDAETATWVIGGNAKGVMTRNAKWAFGSKADAEAFVAANGGRLAGFEEALQAAFTDLYEDTRMIRQKRQKMRRMGHQGKSPRQADHD